MVRISLLGKENVCGNGEKKKVKITNTFTMKKGTKDRRLVFTEDAMFSIARISLSLLSAMVPEKQNSPKRFTPSTNSRMLHAS